MDVVQQIEKYLSSSPLEVSIEQFSPIQKKIDDIYRG
jgi:hypothetical protein